MLYIPHISRSRGSAIIFLVGWIITNTEPFSREEYEARALKAEYFYNIVED